MNGFVNCGNSRLGAAKKTLPRSGSRVKPCDRGTQCNPRALRGPLARQDWGFDRSFWSSLHTDFVGTLSCRYGSEGW